MDKVPLAKYGKKWTKYLWLGMEQSGESTLGLVWNEVDEVPLAWYGMKWTKYPWLGMEQSGQSTLGLV